MKKIIIYLLVVSSLFVCLLSFASCKTFNKTNTSYACGEEITVFANVYSDGNGQTSPTNNLAGLGSKSPVEFNENIFVAEGELVLVVRQGDNYFKDCTTRAEVISVINGKNKSFCIGYLENTEAYNDFLYQFDNITIIEYTDAQEGVEGVTKCALHGFIVDKETAQRLTDYYNKKFLAEKARGSAWDIFIRQFIKLEAYKVVLEGLLTTLIIAVLGLLLGFILGSIIAVVKVINAQNNIIVKILQAIANFYVTVFRGTPMLVQLLIMHFVFFPAVGIHFKNIIIGSLVLKGVVTEAVIAFALNSAAYIAEIMRGGINSVEKGQLEAGRALGLSYPKTMIKVVIPQAFKNVLPTLGNEFIALIKETSVASLIAVTDLTKAFQNIASSTYEYIVPYLILALFYLVLVIFISLLVKLLEKKLKKA